VEEPLGWETVFAWLEAEPAGIPKLVTGSSAAIIKIVNTNIILARGVSFFSIDGEGNLT